MLVVKLTIWWVRSNSIREIGRMDMMVPAEGFEYTR
jgi:hypothetical protein